MSDPRFRARVVRLLHGDFRADDLKTLFLYARDRCDGSEAVREIGDFIAHHDERNKGIITRATRDWFTVTRFMAPQFMPDAKALDEWCLPLDTPAYLKAAFRRRTASTFKLHSGMSITAGRRALERLLNRFETNLDGTLRFTRFIMPDERHVFNVLTNSLEAAYAFSAEQLFAEFQASLVKNRILLQAERNALAATKPHILLLAVAAMHNNDIIMEDKSKIRLMGQVSRNGNLLEVYATVPTGIIKPKPISIRSAIFGGQIDDIGSISAELLRDANWTTEIELRDDGRLHALN